ncbi:MAG: hypothetical protein ABIB47_01780 [Candidatus Woesearchaeota archaeon]
MRRSVITGTGCEIPSRVITPEFFLQSEFYDSEGNRHMNKDNPPREKTTAEIVAEFQNTAGIIERRYVTEGVITSDLGYEASKKAIEASGVYPDSIDIIIFAHDFGDNETSGTHLDLVPSIASRIKHGLGIVNPSAVAFDMIGHPSRLSRIMGAITSEDSLVLNDLKAGSLDKDVALRAAEEFLWRGDPEALRELVVIHHPEQTTPSLAEKVKSMLGISNPCTVAYDIVFGCPGWLQGVIQAGQYIQAGLANTVLVIGAEVLSKVADPFDRDGQIYADGGGASIVRAVDTTELIGILGYGMRSDTRDAEGNDLLYKLWMGPSNQPGFKGDGLYLKMLGNDIYKYAVGKVPEVMRQCLEGIGLTPQDVAKAFLHQALERMDHDLLSKLMGVKPIVVREVVGGKTVKRRFVPPEIINRYMPMTVARLGNSSVATLPTLFDLVLRGDPDKLLNGGMSNHILNPMDLIMFASVGAGLNINAVSYRMPKLPIERHYRWAV